MHYLEHPNLKTIRPLLTDPRISEIMINGPQRLYIERAGRIEKCAPIFPTPQHLEIAIEALISFSGRAVNARSPFSDFRLPDGSRVNVVIAPIALDGPIVTIRRAIRSLKTLDDIVDLGTLTPRMATFLQVAVKARANILFSGGTGSGKTTLLGMLSASIDPSERIVIVEDTAELELALPHVVRMECRPPNIEGAGAIPLTDLLKNSLRMRPSRVILGEIRGEEAFDLLSAFSSGHEGGFAVLHASSPMQTISRLEMMVLARGLPYPLWAIQQQIASGVDFIIQMARLPDGTRRTTHITAVQGTKDDAVLLQDIYYWDFDTERFMCSGDEPRCMPRMNREMPGIDAMLHQGPA